MLRYNLFFEYQIDKIIVVQQYYNSNNLMSRSFYIDSKLIVILAYYNKEKIILNIVV